LLVPILIYLAIGACLVYGAAQNRRLRLRNITRGLLMSYISIAFLLVIGEIFFRTSFAESDGIPTLALKNWQDRYWHLNSLGYRDPEWTPADWEGKHTVLVVGDSLTAGWGIENPDRRFSGVLQSLLGEEYVVMNLGKAGASTAEALENLKSFPLQNPDDVILQYTLNDIENAASSIGQNPGLDPGSAMPAWANESYLGNFVYWRFIRAFSPQTIGGSTYHEWLHAMYDNSVVWAIHETQLNAVVDQIEAMGARPGFVIFPDMGNPFDSIPYVDRVAQVFEARGYKDRTIKLFDQAEAMPFAERVVSAKDLHPSAKFDQVVGQLLYEQLFQSDDAP
jgi:lysophospholipase L1-like esterase